MNYIKTIFDLWQLKKNEKKTAGEISSLQTKKLKRLLHYAYEHSAYYRKGLDYVQFFVRFVPEILPDPKTGKKRLILTDMEAA